MADIDLTQYEDRKIDIAVMHGTVTSSGTLMTQSLFDSGGGEVCTGPYMVAQTFINALFTEIDSKLYARDETCGFMTSARQGKLRSEGDVFMAFGLAKAKIARWLAEDADESDHPGDRFADAELNGIALSAGSLSLAITVTTLEGSTAGIIVPINVVP